MTKLFKILIPLSLLLGLTLACGLGEGGEEIPPPTEQPSGGEEPAPAEAPSGEEGVESPGGEEEELDLSSVTEGLQSLDSYRSHFEMTFEGTTEGTAQHWTYEMDTEYVRDPFAQRLVIQSSDVGESIEVVQIGDRQYLIFGEGQCIATSAGEGEAMDMEMFEPDDVLGGLENAHRVWPDENVNGILCRHYTFDESSIIWAGFVHAEGEVWVATDGNYVVKYVLQAEGKDPATGNEGHIEWEYEIRDVNAAITIEPPPDCEAAGSEFPIMPDATDVSTMTGMTMYTSASAFDDVLAFYQEQMEANGWSETGDSFVTQGTAMLNYTKDGHTATITLSSEDGKVSVLIMSD